MDRSDEPPERSRAARRASKTRQRLLDAALTTINAHGFDGCTIEDITELADVGKGTYYRHFPDKSAIFQELLLVAVSDVVSRIESRRAQATSLDTAVSAIVSAHAESYTASPAFLLLFLQGQSIAATRPTVIPGLAQPMARYFMEIDKALAPHLPQGTDESKRRRLSCAISASICGFLAAALTGMKNGEETTASFGTVSQALLAGLPQWLK
jgi:AcrR family transcriptional regulator